MRNRRATMPAPIRKKDGRMLYFAYGSNLNIGAMLMRCPEAKPLYALQLADCQLVFRSVADVIYKRGAVCMGGVWSITRDCEKALDRYEGVSQGMYSKRYFELRMKSGIMRPVLFYKMRETGICPPPVGYLNIIEQGFVDFDLDRAYLEAAVAHAWDDKELTAGIRKRHNRRGHDARLSRVTTLGQGK